MNVKGTITANGALADLFTPAQRGKHLIVIGSNDDDVDFDSGTVALFQHGIKLKDTAGNDVEASAAARFVVDELTDDVAVKTTTTSVASAANVDISVYKLPDVA